MTKKTDMFKISDEEMKTRHKQDPRHRLVPRMYAANPTHYSARQLSALLREAGDRFTRVCEQVDEKKRLANRFCKARHAAGECRHERPNRCETCPVNVTLDLAFDPPLTLAEMDIDHPPDDQP